MASDQLAIKMQDTQSTGWLQTTHEKTVIFYMTASHRLFLKVGLLSGVETGLLTAGILMAQLST